MDLAEVHQGFIDGGVSQQLVNELLEAYTEAKRRFYLNDHRPGAVEGGRFSEAAFRVIQDAVLGNYTPIGKNLPSVTKLLLQLENASAASYVDSLRLHIPRTLRVIYDIRNKRDSAHLGDGIDPNLQDATLVVGCMDWVMAEFVRLYHSVGPDDAQRIIQELVTKDVPAVQEIAGQPVILKKLKAREQVLLMLYRSGTERGSSLDELAQWLRITRKDHLRDRLRTLDGLGLVLEHPGTGQFHLTAAGVRFVEQNRLAQPG